MKIVFTLLIMQADSSPLHPFWLSHQSTLASCCKLIPLIFFESSTLQGHRQAYYFKKYFYY